MVKDNNRISKISDRNDVSEGKKGSRYKKGRLIVNRKKRKEDIRRGVFIRVFKLDNEIRFR